MFGDFYQEPANTDTEPEVPALEVFIQTTAEMDIDPDVMVDVLEDDPEALAIIAAEAM